MTLFFIVILVILYLGLAYCHKVSNDYAERLNKKIELHIIPNWKVLREKTAKLIEEVGRDYLDKNAGKKAGLVRDIEGSGKGALGLKFVLGRDYCWNQAYKTFQEELFYSGQVYGGAAHEKWEGEKDPYFRLEEKTVEIKAPDGRLTAFRRVIRVSLVYILDDSFLDGKQKTIKLGDIPVAALSPFINHNSEKTWKKWRALLLEHGITVADDSPMPGFFELRHENFWLYLKTYEGDRF